jgi:hypothetical protein
VEILRLATPDGLMSCWDPGTSSATSRAAVAEDV